MIPLEDARDAIKAATAMSRDLFVSAWSAATGEEFHAAPENVRVRGLIEAGAWYDTAVALLDRATSGCSWQTGFVSESDADSEDPAGPWARVFVDVEEVDALIASAPTMPLAILLAVTVAVIAERAYDAELI